MRQRSGRGQSYARAAPIRCVWMASRASLGSGSERDHPPSIQGCDRVAVLARPAWRRSKERIRRPVRILRCSLPQDAFVSAFFRSVVRGFPFTHLGDLVDAEGLGHSLLYEGGGSHGRRRVDGWMEVGGRAWAVGEGTRGTEDDVCWMQRWSMFQAHRLGNPLRPIGSQDGIRPGRSIQTESWKERRRKDERRRGRRGRGAVSRGTSSAHAARMGTVERDAKIGTRADEESPA